MNNDFELKTNVAPMYYTCVCFYHVTYTFRVNLRSVIAWISKNSLLETGAISEVKLTVTGLKQTTTNFENEHSTIECSFTN